MKLFIVSALSLMIAAGVPAQERLLTRNGSISFYSNTSLEDIEAHTQTAVSVMDKKTGRVEFSVLIRSFSFEKALMQEHFNENYLESDKFPKSVFKGSIDDISIIDFNKEGKYSVTITGQLTVHGETKTITTPVVFTIQKESVLAAAEFLINLTDYKIQIPALVKDKISNAIKIAVNLKYDPVSTPAKNN
jgi:polyisoprenoid-binding protein YceI